MPTATGRGRLVKILSSNVAAVEICSVRLSVEKLAQAKHAPTVFNAPPPPPPKKKKNEKLAIAVRVLQNT